jgi:hypothetical protein
MSALSFAVEVGTIAFCAGIIHNSKTGFPAPAPASLGFFGRAGYYISHPRFRDWVIGLSTAFTIGEALDCFEKRKWPRITWKSCGVWTVLLFLASLGGTRLDALIAYR